MFAKLMFAEHDARVIGSASQWVETRLRESDVADVDGLVNEAMKMFTAGWDAEARDARSPAGMNAFAG